jgi:hypothetical protein
MSRERNEVDTVKEVKKVDIVLEGLINRAAIHVRDGLVFERVYNTIVNKEGVMITKYIDARCMFAPQYQLEIPIAIWEQVVECVGKILEPRATQLPVFPTAGTPPSVFPPSAIHLPAEPPIADRPIMGRPTNPIVIPEPPEVAPPIAGGPSLHPSNPMVPGAEPKR